MSGVKKVLKRPSIRRLPAYLYRLTEMRSGGITIVSAPELARYMKSSEIVIRKDLAITGITGQPGVGYVIDDLVEAIRKFLRWDDAADAVLAGVGSLGSAILGYDAFVEYGLKIVAAFDASPDKIGKVVHNRIIRDIAELPDFIRQTQTKVGIICVPAANAQEVADLMVKGGISGIWNFANVSLKAPDNVALQRESLAGGWALLSVELNHKTQN